MNRRILYVHNSADFYNASRSPMRQRTLEHGRFEPLVIPQAERLLAELVHSGGVRVIAYPAFSVIDRAIFRSGQLPLFLLNTPRSVLPQPGWKEHIEDASV